jgi:hypothetical protein
MLRLFSIARRRGEMSRWLARSLSHQCALTAFASCLSIASASVKARLALHHQGALPVDRFQADEVLQDIERRCRCTVCGWRRADLRPDYSKQQAAGQSVGWMMPPSNRK